MKWVEGSLCLNLSLLLFITFNHSPPELIFELTTRQLHFIKHVDSQEALLIFHLQSCAQSASPHAYTISNSPFYPAEFLSPLQWFKEQRGNGRATVSFTLREVMMSLPSQRYRYILQTGRLFSEAIIMLTASRSITLNCSHYNTCALMIILYYNGIDPVEGLTPRIVLHR